MATCRFLNAKLASVAAYKTQISMHKQWQHPGRPSSLTDTSMTIIFIRPWQGEAKNLFVATLLLMLN
jgi:hypothetical protein